MRRLPLRWKLTILYTLFMIVLTAGMLGVLFSLSSSSIASTVESELEEKVFKAFEDVEMEDGRLHVDPDLSEVEDGVYLSVYDKSHTLLGGRIPYDFTEKTALSQGLKKITASGVRWYVLDAPAVMDGFGEIYVRGIASVTKAESSLGVTLRLSLILFPVMVLLMSAFGYFFSGRALRPVVRITATAREIYEQEDLSKRIGLTKGKDEIHQLAETFDQMLEKLETAFEREKQFTSDASHELRTPVTVILSQCEYLLEEGNLSEEERMSVEAIQRKAQSMARMISQLLFLSRADQDRQALQKERLDLSMLTELVSEEQQELARDRGVCISTEIQPGISGYADETLFIRIWMNLIGNAVAYGREGGWVKVGLSEKNGRLYGRVQDNGIGISEEHLEKIWERFYQVDGSRGGQQNAGSGLGLPMVKWIVEAHGGKIQAVSEYGKGSEFSFSFPIDEKN